MDREKHDVGIFRSQQRRDRPATLRVPGVRQRRGLHRRPQRIPRRGDERHRPAVQGTALAAGLPHRRPDHQGRRVRHRPGLRRGSLRHDRAVQPDPVQRGAAALSGSGDRPDGRRPEGPGSEYPATVVVRGPNIFTITEVQGSYGRLKSGAGWLNLHYAEWLCSE